MQHLVLQLNVEQKSLVDNWSIPYSFFAIVVSLPHVDCAVKAAFGTTSDMLLASDSGKGFVSVVPHQPIINSPQAWFFIF